MLVSVSAFASNLTERDVYGLLSDNYTGAVDRIGESEDNVRWWLGSSYATNGGSYDVARAVAKVEISTAPANAKEGKNYWEFIMEKWDSVQTDFPTNYWTAIVLCSVASNNSSPSPKNLSRFKYLDFWIKPKTGDITKVFIGMTDSADRCVSLGSLGVKNSDTWQHVVLDITTLPNINLANIKNFLVMKTENNTLSGNTSYYMDNVVLRTDSSSASFKATLKKIESEQWAPENPTQITWDDEAISAARNRGDASLWWTSGQYIELDMDVYSYAWTVRVYSNNGASGRAGMYATVGGKDYTVPMCWRAYNGTLTEGPNGDTYVIEETADHALYDHGIGPTYFPWMYMSDIADVDLDKPKDVDYITVWDSSLGYHGFSSANPWEGFYEFKTISGKPTVEKKPKLYFGGKFGDAGGGVTYTGNIVIQLNQE